MKQMDLNVYGLCEMSQEEMVVLNGSGGGFWGKLFSIAAIYDAVTDFCEGVVDGYNAQQSK